MFLLNKDFFTKNAKKFSFLFLFLSSVSFSFSENFRIKDLIPIELTQINQKVTVKSGINDAIWITLPQDLTYINGVELTLKIPEEIVTWRDSVAYMLYENITPSPEKDNKNYYGERTHVSTIPGNFSLKIYIPISKDFSIKNNPYSVKLPIQNDLKNGIFLRFMMVMKGTPESLENSILEITAKPVLKNKGALELSINPDLSEEKKYLVAIDDVPIQNYKHKLLSTGEHHLSITSDSYRNEIRTFRIEQAKTTSLSVKLRGIEPLLKILCPKNTAVYLDGKAIKSISESIAVSQGEHIVKFILGDYEVVKTVNTINGRTYALSLNIDASITEED